MSFDLNNIYVQGILITVIGTLLVTIIIYLVNQIKKSGSGMFSILGQRVRQETHLEIYRKTVNEEMLRISHPWMKEGQTLNDILVSINFNVKGLTVKEELEAYLNRIFREDNSPRILILGSPGSGKTVAMRMIVKIIWTVIPKTILVPVFLTFSDIKGVSNHKGLEEKIIKKLEYYQFEQGQRNNLTAEKFISEYLTSGKIVLLFDGYDELEKSAREAAAKLLKDFLGTYRKIPAVISSRVAVYEKEPVFNQLNPKIVEMAPFTPFAILKFISQWKFEGSKSSHELFELINGKAHLSEMASNPLMLTIITFLYSLPKYTLPDNRVEFYERCTRALLEEWDRARDTARANKFESHQKIAVLNRVAFDHISKAAKTDELIPENFIHTITREEMGRLSLKTSEYSAMKDEIVLNSGLLQAIPPTDYRFPHRTFTEFFAANYIVTEKSYQEILGLYEQDAEKWRETLLLYIGLNKNKTYSNKILEHLKKEFVSSCQAKAPPKLLVFNALTECAVPDPDLANEILDLADKFLIKESPLAGIIQELGYIAANPRWAHAKKAKQILLNLLQRKLPDNVFHQVFLALLRARDEGTTQIIRQNLHRLNLIELFSTLTSVDKYFVHKLLALDLSAKEKSEIIEGLKEASNLEVLGSLLIENSDEDIKTLCAYALFRMSGLPGFFKFLDQAEIGFLEPKLRGLIDTKLNEWGWRWNIPEKETGKKMAVLICYLSAQWIMLNQQVARETDLKEENNWFRYLTNGFLVEKGLAFHEFNLLGFTASVFATKNTLKKHWKRKINWDSAWYKLMGNRVFILATMFLISSCAFPALLGIVGLLFLLFRWTSNSFYNYLFDTFTISFTLITYAVFFVVNYILAKTETEDNRVVISLLGPMGLIAVSSWPPDFLKSLFYLGLGFIYMFLPFHHTVYNILYFLSFISILIIVSDFRQLNFIFIYNQNLRKLYKFLDESQEHEK